jgi:microbial collagenase
MLHRLALVVAALATLLTISAGQAAGPLQDPVQQTAETTFAPRAIGPAGFETTGPYDAFDLCSRAGLDARRPRQARRAQPVLSRRDRTAQRLARNLVVTLPAQVPAPAPTGPQPAGGQGQGAAGQGGGPQIPVATTSAAAFAALSGQALVDELADPQSVLDVLWAFDGDVETVMAQGNVALVAAEIGLLGAQLAANADRLAGLVYFLQIAYFHEFYQASLSYDGATNDACALAVASLATSPDFLLETQLVRDLRSSWIVTIDSVNATHLALPAIEDLIERWNADPSLANQYTERVDAFGIFFSLARQIGNANASQPNSWTGIVPASLVADMQVPALDLAYTPNTAPITENALFAIAHFAYLDTPTSDAGHQTLSAAFNAFPVYSGPWFRALRDLDYFYGGVLSDGTVLDIDQYQADVEAIALPNTFTFDQGALVFRTAISRAKAEAMYAAIQEVESQFFRATGNDAAVLGDSGDPLTLVIYASPDDYALYQPFLTGLSTANGGIYIEGDTTLYTYDRTPQQSYFTLEELLRHEYTHFLDGRFQVVGGFYGAGTLYEGGRIDTLGEGLAEYCVGSTRADGILRREQMLTQVANDPLGPMTIAEVLLGTYDLGFRFYPHSACIQKFLEDEAPDLQLELYATVRTNDVAAFDALRDQIVNDAQLQTDYDAWLAASIADVQSGTGLFAEDVPTVAPPAGLPTGNQTAVRGELEGAAGVGASEFYAWGSRYRFEREIALPVAANATSAELRDAFSAHLDAVFLTGLEPAGPNFQSQVAWNGAIDHAGTSASARVYVEGPFRVDLGDTVPPAAPIGLMGDGSGAAIELSWVPNGEDDLAGYRIHSSPTSGGPFTQVSTQTLTATNGTVTDASSLLTYYVVTAVDAAGNESGHSNEISVGLERRVLVINGYFDNGNFSNTQSYIDGLTALGLGFEVWNPFTDGPVTDALLANFVDGMVIWSVGYTNPSFSGQFDAARRAMLRTYLDAGGNLMISGAYLASNFDSTPLFTDYFHVDNVVASIDLPKQRGRTGNPVGGGINLTSTYTGYNSEIDVSAPGEQAFTYIPGGGTGQIQSSGASAATIEDGYRVLYLAQPFSTLDGPSRSALLERATDWLIPSEPTLSITPSLAGATNTIRVRNGQPGENVLFLVGWIPGNLPTGCPSGARIGIKNWIQFLTLPCDANGEIQFDVDVPPVFAGLTFLIQGAMLGTCDTTNTVTAAF